MPLEQIANIAEVIGLLVVGLTLSCFSRDKYTKIPALQDLLLRFKNTAAVTLWYRGIGNSERSSDLFLTRLADLKLNG